MAYNKHQNSITNPSSDWFDQTKKKKTVRIVEW